MLRGGCFFQQFIVDCYAIIVETRLRYIRVHQRPLRTKMYKNVRDAMSQQDIYGSCIGSVLFYQQALYQILDICLKSIKMQWPFADFLDIPNYLLHSPTILNGQK